MSKDKRKIMRVKVNFEFLAKMLKIKQDKIIVSNAPEDLEVIQIESDFDLGFNKICYMYCYSDTFEPVPEGEKIPDHPGIIYKAFYGDEALKIVELAGNLSNE